MILPKVHSELLKDHIKFIVNCFEKYLIKQRKIISDHIDHSENASKFSQLQNEQNIALIYINFIIHYDLYDLI